MKLEGPQKLVGYIRVSTKDRQKLSLEAQEAALKKWCNQNGIKLVRIYKERVSTRKSVKERPVLKTAARSAAAVDGLLVYRRDRLARSPHDAQVVEKYLLRHNAAVWAVDGNNEQTPEGRLMRNVMDSFAQYERETTVERIKRVLEHKKAKGERVGTCPYGYTADKDGKLIEDPAEQEVLWLTRKYAHLTQTALAKKLNELGHRTRRRNTWTQRQVSKLLKRMKKKNEIR